MPSPDAWMERWHADSRRAFDSRDPPPPPIDPWGGGGDDGRMEKRIERLEGLAQEAEKRLVRIETKVDSLATKEDLQKELVGTTRWYVGWSTSIGVALVAAVYFIAKNVQP